MLTWLGIGGGLTFPFINLLGYFRGQSCPAIPSALPAIITLTVVSLVKVPGALYNCIQRVKAGELPAGQIELSGQAEDGSLCELYKGQLMLLKIEQAVMYLSFAIGAFWFFPLGMMHRDVRHDEEQCARFIYTMIFVTGLIYLILTCIAVLVLLSVGVGCIKKPATPKTPGITDFSGAL